MRRIIHFELRTARFSEYIHKIYGAPTMLWEKAPCVLDTAIGGRNGASRVRANLWQPVCAIDGGMSAVVCACQLAREKETHRCRRFVPRRAFLTIRGTSQRNQREVKVHLGKNHG